MANPWPDEKIEALRKLVAEGHSFSIIGDKLGVTRNAALGKASREGMCTGRDRPGHAELRRQRNAQQSRRNHFGASKPSRPFNFAKKPAAKQFPRPPTPYTDHAERSPHGPDTVVPHNIALVDLEPHHCRWPIGTGPYAFCGHARLPGVPYCRAHLIRSSDPRERARIEAMPDPIEPSAPASEPAKDSHAMAP